ncbi:unnamed protein product [Prunus brigantina]
MLSKITLIQALSLRVYCLFIECVLRVYCMCISHVYCRPHQRTQKEPAASWKR